MNSLAGLVVDSAARAPLAAAVEDGDAALSYAELVAHAERLAAELAALGVAPGVTVAIASERRRAIVVGLLAIQMAGGACVPLDPDYPAQRLRFMLDDSAPAALLASPRAQTRLAGFAGPVITLDERAESATQAGGREGRAAPPRSGAPGLPGDDEALAYVLYTSGSTGEPKGVMLPNRSLAHHAAAVVALYELRAGDRVLQFASLGFDVCIEEIFPTLAAGATVVLRPDGVPILGRDWTAWLQRARISVLNLPTAYWHEWVHDLERTGERVPPDVRLVVAGGEKPLGALYRRWQEVAGRQVRWLNAYGPAETGPLATAYEPPADRPWPPERDPPLGRPVGEATLDVLDDRGGPVTAGGVGELWIGGPGVARGYLHRPELTAERFVADAGAPTVRRFRTGDLVRVCEDGSLEFAGRSDEQVKIRGFRVELVEVEAALARHPGVAEAAVATRAGAAGRRLGDLRLVAYIVPSAGEVDPTELRRFLGGVLPPQMIPATLVRLSSLPRTAHGKVDRDALPEPEDARALPAPDHSPGTTAERGIAAIWSRVLGLDGIGVDENFFDLGGHSLLAAQVVAAVRDEFDVPVGMADFLAAPTIAGLGNAVESARPAGDVPPPLRPARRAPGERFPLTLSQEQMWRLEMAADPRGLYNITALYRFRHAVAADALERSLAHVVDRHESLRLHFEAEADRAMQLVEPAVHVELRVCDLRALPEAERDLEELVAAQDAEPFDVTRAPLLRACLYVLSDDESVLAVTLDHLVCDGTSAYILLSEVTAAYESLTAGAAVPASPLAVQYLDFARWQRAWFTESRLQDQLEFWRERLRGMPLGPAVPFDTVPQQPSRRITVHRFSIEGSDYTGLGRLARATRSTRFIVTVAAVQALCSIAGGRTDIVFSTTLSGRQRAEIDGVIGCFHGVGRIRTDLSGDPAFAEIAGRTRDSVMALFEHQDIPFGRIRAAVQPEFPTGGPALLAAVPIELQYFHTAHDAWAPGAGVVERPGGDPGPARLHFRGHMHPLLLTFLDDDRALRGELSYKIDYYTATTIERLTSGLQRLVAAVVRDPQVRLSGLASMVDDAREVAARSLAAVTGPAQLTETPRG